MVKYAKSDCPNSIKFGRERVAHCLSATLVSLKMTSSTRDADARRARGFAAHARKRHRIFLDAADDVNKKRQSRATGIK